MSTVTLVWTRLDSSYESIDDGLIPNVLGVVEDVVAIPVHFPKHLAKHVRESVKNVNQPSIITQVGGLTPSLEVSESKRDEVKSLQTSKLNTKSDLGIDGYHTCLAQLY